MLQIQNTIKPHLGVNILQTGTELHLADKAMLMIHGRGADAASIAELGGHLNAEKITFFAPQADGFSWYPRRFIEKREANEPGISSGLKLIDAIMNALNLQGIKSDKIYLLGFSQGACLAVDYVARNPKKYGGVFCLSGGLIGAQINQADYKGDLQKTPVFLGCSENDFHIPEDRVHESAAIFASLNAKVTKRLYPNMGHTINRDELDFINQVLMQ